MQLTLVMVKADGTSKEVEVNSLPASVGRGDTCRFRIPLPSISRTHFEFYLEDDELMIRDLESRNGTFVNGERITKQELVPGDLVAVGPCVMVVRIDGHPKQIDPLESFAAGAVGEEVGVSAASPPSSNAPTVDAPAPPPANAGFDPLVGGNDDSDDFDIDDLDLDLDSR